jgi:hypothetical protein
MTQGFVVTLSPSAAPLSSTAGEHRRRHTAYDLMERLLSWLGGDTQRVTHRDIKRAIEDAYREFPGLHDWQFLNAVGRVNINAAQTLGTVAYDHTGGSYERLLTITGATWPSWAQRGYIRVGEVTYNVETRIDDTRLTLTDAFNPGADLAAGTSYMIGQDIYELPADFLKSDRAQTEEFWGGMYFVPTREWMQERRHDDGNIGVPRRYTFLGDPRGTGGLVLAVAPTPDLDSSLDFVYRRKMRDLRVWDSSTGTASVVASSTVITLADGGTFKAWMKGSVVRLAYTADPPDGPDSPESPALERTITEILSSTTAQLDESADETISGVGYRISDVLDCEDESMFNALVFGARKHLAIARGRDDADAIQGQWLFHLTLAKEADARDVGRRSASVGGDFPRRLADGRQGADIE